MNFLIDGNYIFVYLPFSKKIIPIHKIINLQIKQKKFPHSNDSAKYTFFSILYSSLNISSPLQKKKLYILHLSSENVLKERERERRCK